MADNFPTLSTILAECKQGEHVECPRCFKSLVSGRLIRCVCPCHRDKKLADAKGGENVK